MMYRRILLLILICFSAGNIKAQQPLSAANITTSTSNTGTGKFYHATNRAHEAARAVEFDERTVAASTFLANINQYFNIPAEFSFVETESNTDDLGMRHHLIQQYYKGIALEGLAYRVHAKNGFVTSANGKAIRDIKLDINTILSEEQAFELAVAHLQTKDTLFRSGKKLIVSKDFTFTPESFSIAFQFDIDVSLIERWRISIDAHNGQVINKVSLVHTCLPPPPPVYGTGIGMTNYYGSKTISVEKRENGSSWLNGQSEHGGRFGVWDYGNASIFKLLLEPNYTHGPIFASPDSIFDDPYDQVAVSVHWALEQTYEYYFTRHRRNSYNNGGKYIQSYVHVDKDWDNAAWTGKLLVFGDGSNNNPPVELDVVSHEFTHGVTQHEAELTYSYEPGALNESFSDIFAKAVEFTTLSNEATWQLGRHFRPGGIRDMSNPNLKGQPDTYQGNLWYEGYEDNGGVHINSGVQNFWFYLLCEGGSGVNDRGVSYSVNSIGMDTAVNIAYRNLTEYLISSSDYLDSRIGSLLATADLYGKNSSIYQEVDRAWDAVGVIDEPIITSLTLYDITATTVKFNGSLLPRGDSVTYHVEYGITPEFGSSSAIYEYTGTVEGIVTGLQSETMYYVRLVASNKNGVSYADANEFTTLPLAPLTIIKNTVDVSDTKATFYGEVNPNSLPTSFYFEYGPTPDMDLVTPSYSLPDTTEYLKVSASMSDLQPRQTYYYKLIATNDAASSATDSVTFFTALKPVINSFAPVTATPGTEITISGDRFHPIPEKNWVSFGATRAIVLSSSPTELKVEVPTGASFGPISLVDTESGLATESVREFVPTFIGEFGKGDLQLRAAFDDIVVRQMEVHDMDGDGRPDIVISHDDGITVLQNVNTGGDITNELFVPFNALVNNSFNFRSLVDLDGNGLRDIVASHQGAVWVYPNFSVPGYIFFGAPVKLPFANIRLLFNDFDNDGRIDVAGVGALPGDSSMLAIFRNQNPKGMLSADGFVQQYSKSFPYHFFNLDLKTVGDLNNNGTPDLLYSDYGSDQFSILVNKSYPDVFEFEEIIVPDSVNGRIATCFVQDLNQDGWRDIISMPTGLGKMTIFENKGPSIDLSKPTVALDKQAVYSLRPGDIDGDGKVDLLVGDQRGRFIVLKNNTEAGEPILDSSFELFEHFGQEKYKNTVRSNAFLNDLNGDGRPEVINYLRYSSNNMEGNQIEIWQNSPNDCLDPSLISVTVSSTTATIVLPPNTALDDFDIAYTSAGSSNWKQVSSMTLTYLYTGASYQLRVAAKCYLGFTSYHYIDFTTECVDLESFSISDVQVNQVTLGAINLSSFEVQYSIADKDEWKTLSRWTDRITNLLPGSTYDLRYRGRCYTPTEFTYAKFTTLCPALSKLTIDQLTFNQAVVSWTSNYAGNAVLEYSTDNITWTLIDETLTLFPLNPGKKYFVRGALECTYSNSDFIHTSFTTPCPKVSMLKADSVTPFSANIKWVDESETGSYAITYSTSAGEVKTAETNSTSFYLDELSPGTQYMVSVAPDCIGSKLITTTSFTTVCYVPFNLSADTMTHSTAVLSWDDSYSGVPYSIDYSVWGSNVWLTTESALTVVSLEELRPGTQYEVRVHINCLSVTASFASVRFETSFYGETIFAPNPTDNTITIHPSKNIIGNYFGIYDNSGRRVADGKLLDYTFDLSDFSAGIYILKIDGEEPMKIVKR